MLNTRLYLRLVEDADGAETGRQTGILRYSGVWKKEVCSGFRHAYTLLDHPIYDPIRIQLGSKYELKERKVEVNYLIIFHFLSLWLRLEAHI